MRFQIVQLVQTRLYLLEQVSNRAKHFRLMNADRLQFEQRIECVVYGIAIHGHLMRRRDTKGTRQLHVHVRAPRHTSAANGAVAGQQIGRVVAFATIDTSQQVLDFGVLVKHLTSKQKRK